MMRAPGTSSHASALHARQGRPLFRTAITSFASSLGLSFDECSRGSFELHRFGKCLICLCGLLRQPHHSLRAGQSTKHLQVAIVLPASWVKADGTRTHILLQQRDEEVYIYSSDRRGPLIQAFFSCTSSFQPSTSNRRQLHHTDRPACTQSPTANARPYLW